MSLVLLFVFSCVLSSVFAHPLPLGLRPRALKILSETSPSFNSTLFLDQLESLESSSLSHIDRRVLSKSFHSSGSSYSSSEIIPLRTSFLRFFSLLFLEEIQSITPSYDVDQYWHEFILFTANYREFCNEHFGHFIDHFPEDIEIEPTPGPTEELPAVASEEIVQQMKEHEKVENEQRKQFNANGWQVTVRYMKMLYGENWSKQDPSDDEGTPAECASCGACVGGKYNSTSTKTSTSSIASAASCGSCGAGNCSGKKQTDNAKKAAAGCGSCGSGSCSSKKAKKAGCGSCGSQTTTTQPTTVPTTAPASTTTAGGCGSCGSNCSGKKKAASTTTPAPTTAAPTTTTTSSCSTGCGSGCGAKKKGQTTSSPTTTTTSGCSTGCGSGCGGKKKRADKTTTTTTAGGCGSACSGSKKEKAPTTSTTTTTAAGCGSCGSGSCSGSVKKADVPKKAAACGSCGAGSCSGKKPKLQQPEPQIVLPLQPQPQQTATE